MNSSFDKVMDQFKFTSSNSQNKRNTSQKQNDDEDDFTPPVHFVRGNSESNNKRQGSNDSDKTIVYSDNNNKNGKNNDSNNNGRDEGDFSSSSASTQDYDVDDEARILPTQPLDSPRSKQNNNNNKQLESKTANTNNNDTQILVFPTNNKNGNAHHDHKNIQLHSSFDRNPDQESYFQQQQQHRGGGTTPKLNFIQNNNYNSNSSPSREAAKKQLHFTASSSSSSLLQPINFNQQPRQQTVVCNEGDDDDDDDLLLLGISKPVTANFNSNSNNRNTVDVVDEDDDDELNLLLTSSQREKLKVEKKNKSSNNNNFSSSTSWIVNDMNASSSSSSSFFLGQHQTSQQDNTFGSSHNDKALFQNYPVESNPFPAGFQKWKNKQARSNVQSLMEDAFLSRLVADSEMFDAFEPFMVKKFVEKVDQREIEATNGDDNADGSISPLLHLQAITPVGGASNAADPITHSSSAGLDLRPYQIEGVNFLLRNFARGMSSLFSDEQGLGKTATTCCFLSALSSRLKLNGPHLIVAPLVTISSWRRELERWAPDLSIVNYKGSAKQREQFQSIYGPHVFLTNPTLLQSDSKFFKSRLFGVVVFDEAHVLKGHDTKIVKAAMSLNACFRLALTGTPIANTPNELWSLMNFLYPEVRGRGKTYPDKTEDAESKYQAAALLKYIMLRRTKQDILKDLPPKIYHPIAPVDPSYIQALAMEKLFVQAPQVLAEKMLRNLMLNILKLCNHPLLFSVLATKNAWKNKSDSENNNDSALILAAAASSSNSNNPNSHNSVNRSKAQVEARRDRSLKLILENGFTFTDGLEMLLDSGVEICESEIVTSSAKVVQLDKILERINRKVEGDYRGEDFDMKKYNSNSSYNVGEEELEDDNVTTTTHHVMNRVLIFSRFTTQLHILEGFCVLRGYRYERLDGDTLHAERELGMVKFNHPNSQAFIYLISTSAGGVGITLTGANHVVFYDTSFNPSVDKQATDRAHRIGQTRVVHVHRLCIAGSLEESVVQISERKAKMGDYIVDGIGGDGDEETAWEENQRKNKNNNSNAAKFQPGSRKNRREVVVVDSDDDDECDESQNEHEEDEAEDQDDKKKKKSKKYVNATDLASNNNNNPIGLLSIASIKKLISESQKKTSDILRKQEELQESVVKRRLLQKEGMLSQSSPQSQKTKRFKNYDNNSNDDDLKFPLRREREDDQNETDNNNNDQEEDVVFLTQQQQIQHKLEEIESHQQQEKILANDIVDRILKIVLFTHQAAASSGNSNNIDPISIQSDQRKNQVLNSNANANNSDEEYVFSTTTNDDGEPNQNNNNNQNNGSCCYAPVKFTVDQLRILNEMNQAPQPTVEVQSVCFSCKAKAHPVQLLHCKTCVKSFHRRPACLGGSEGDDPASVLPRSLNLEMWSCPRHKCCECDAKDNAKLVTFCCIDCIRSFCVDCLPSYYLDMSEGDGSDLPFISSRYPEMEAEGMCEKRTMKYVRCPDCSHRKRVADGESDEEAEGDDDDDDEDEDAEIAELDQE